MNTHTDKTFSKQYICRYFDLKITFNVTGYKVEGKWRAYFELIWENEYADTSLFGGAFYSKLYKAVQDRTFSYNHKEENKYTKATISNKLRKQIEINHGDFVVRTNLFRCFYKDHLVEEIIGLLKIITPQGKEVTDKVACAYCSKCNCYYMLTSEYNRVSQKGIILCQLIDKDDYYKTGTFNRMNRVNESLLMQNGYNVKANVGLTDIQRQMILESIMENNILTPHRIVSYIDTFILQKRNMPQYNNAVKKWELDKQFVLSYDNEHKREVEIKSIKR